MLVAYIRSHCYSEKREGTVTASDFRKHRPLNIHLYIDYECWVSNIILNDHIVHIAAKEIKKLWKQKGNKFSM